MPNCFKSTIIATMGHKDAAHKEYVTPNQIITGNGDRAVVAKHTCTKAKLTWKGRTTTVVKTVITTVITTQCSDNNSTESAEKVSTF